MEFYQEFEENRLQSVISWIVDIIVAITFAIFFVYAVGCRVEINGSSMNPVLESGAVVLMNRLAYDLGTPHRFDIAVFEEKSQNGKWNVKRIIGLPGETIQIRDNRIYINGEPLEAEESLAAASIAGIAEYPIELGMDEYFLIGDNRDSSEDSRSSGIGNIKKEQLLGKAWLRFQPFSELGLIR